MIGQDLTTQDVISQLVAPQEAARQGLDHSPVPFRSRAVYLRLVSTKAKALDYAAGGFHVSVDRGLGGGCSDPWSKQDGGTRAAPCSSPLGRADARDAWTLAAARYRLAYGAAEGGAPLEDAKSILRNANALADQAYALEGIAPPRDPGHVATPQEPTAPAEPAVSFRHAFSPVKVGLASVGGLALVGLFLWASSRGGEKDRKRAIRRRQAGRYAR